MKIFSGQVTSIIDTSTIVVSVTRLAKHSLYKKQLHRSKKYQVHLPSEFIPKLGDKVKIRETKPISKHKKFVLIVPQSVEKKTKKTKNNP